MDEDEEGLSPPSHFNDAVAVIETAAFTAQNDEEMTWGFGPDPSFIPPAYEIDGNCIMTKRFGYAWDMC
ncbi:hypothetical protein FGRMN_2132 [Fusarium graminum]|nr:hypothetical protein FGRMN_2132 [Fusarium graminum]